MNGRFSQNSSNLTCKNSSTVDYFLSSAHHFEFGSSFLISEFDSLYSDAHCPISLTINLCPLKDDNYEQINQNTPQTKLWHDQKRELVIENLNNEEVARISSTLDSISSQDNKFR